MFLTFYSMKNIIWVVISIIISYHKYLFTTHYILDYLFKLSFGSFWQKRGESIQGVTCEIRRELVHWGGVATLYSFYVITCFGLTCSNDYSLASSLIYLCACFCSNAMICFEDLVVKGFCHKDAKGGDC